MKRVGDVDSRVLYPIHKSISFTTRNIMRIKNLLAFFVALVVASAPAGAFTRGDLNSDGTVDVSDVNAVINIMLGKTQAGGNRLLADVTSDGTVDVSDVNALINIMLGKAHAISEKPRYMWIDASANFPVFANSKDNIRRDLARARAAGITDVVVDVRPSEGDVLFDCSVIDQVTSLPYWDGPYYRKCTRTATWDYLQAFIDIGHELCLRVHAGVNTMVGGYEYLYGMGKQGVVFRDATKRDWVTVLNTADGLVNAMDDAGHNCKFFNPANDEVQQYLLTMLADLAQYQLDGIVLDRCRYDEFLSDFSDVSRQKFEQYLGHTVTDWPSSVMTPGMAVSPLPWWPPTYFKQWMAFRAKVIHDFIVRARDTVKAVNPDVQFAAYVGGWYSTYYEYGVNWASNRYQTSNYYSRWANSDYHNYGLAGELDFLLLGAYAGTESIYGTGEWTCEGFCRQAQTLLMGDVEFAGGPDVGNPTGWPDGGKASEVTQTVDACINHADGYFIFDMVHVRNFDYWNAIRQGVDNYLNTLQ